ncbi:Glycosyltransferase, GT2 family [Methylomagnum ishizawai]|uniref:Glycosyltransferase, GT2 family n=1 Tax=Methylomagnum ishizawai TaxID=1760988 RepID=A0A1Y6D0U3_9GAMM|nr:glycosyltransferase [Methylomagnum ishizawai]SMF93595.1 Glycosyltransferase, GT2 family [Methylomagnum ishizawai]
MSALDFPPISLIIPNFNGSALLKANLPAVLRAAADYPGTAAVIVVDDGSRDDSAALVRSEFPQVTLIEHPVNQGFAEAIHSGVAAAPTEVLVFLNSDVSPAQDFLAPLVGHFERPEIFSVTPLVLDKQGGCNEVSWRCYHLQSGRFRAMQWAPPAIFNHPWKTLFASGGSMMLRKSMFTALGGFLPIFKPFYSEDFDLGLRAWRRGWISLLEPRSRVVHDSGSGSIKTNIAAKYIRAVRIRNHFLLEWLHLPARDIWLRLLPGYLWRSASRLVTFNWVYFAGLAGALIRLPEALRLRTEIQASATLDFWTLMADIEHSQHH